MTAFGMVIYVRLALFDDALLIIVFQVAIAICGMTLLEKLTFTRHVQEDLWELYLGCWKHSPDNHLTVEDAVDKIARISERHCRVDVYLVRRARIKSQDRQSRHPRFWIRCCFGSHSSSGSVSMLMALS